MTGGVLLVALRIVQDFRRAVWQAELAHYSQLNLVRDGALVDDGQVERSLSCFAAQQLSLTLYHRLDCLLVRHCDKGEHLQTCHNYATLCIPSVNTGSFIDRMQAFKSIKFNVASRINST